MRAAQAPLYELETLITASRFLVKKKKNPVLSIAKTEIDFNAKEDIKSVKEYEKTKIKSVSSDDALVVRTLNNQDKYVTLDHDETAIIRRGVYFHGIKIPKEAWKKVFVSLGLQRIASQYTTAVYCPVVAVPCWDGEIPTTPNATLNAAKQYVALYNKTVKQADRLTIIGEPHRVEAHSHAWFLCLPKTLANDPNFRFGSWVFTEMPRAVSSAKSIAA
jgi:hypothetical protein